MFTVPRDFSLFPADCKLTYALFTIYSSKPTYMNDKTILEASFGQNTDHKATNLNPLNNFKKVTFSWAPYVVNLSHNIKLDIPKNQY